MNFGGGVGGGEAGGVDGEIETGKEQGEEQGRGDGAGGKNRGLEGEGNGDAKNMDGDKEPNSSFSISFSSLTRPGGSTPYLQGMIHSVNCMSMYHTPILHICVWCSST